MDKLFAIVSHKSYIEDETIGKGYTYNSYISAYENLCESNAGCTIKELRYDPAKDFDWDTCIMLLEVDDHKNVVAKYPVEYYSIKKSYSMYDTNPIRLIDLMNTLYDDTTVQLFIGFHENKCEYNNLEEIPDKYFNYKVKGIYYHIDPAITDCTHKIIMRIKIEA
jgi:hypothetical protein